MAAHRNNVPTKVEDILKQTQKDGFKGINVEKPIDLEFDEGNLLASDPNQIDLKKFRQNREAFLLQMARDNTQLLFNKIWELPVERVENVVIAKLPEPTTRIPREKPVPKEKQLTKWQQYAKMKGITKRKKGRMVWDNETQEWKPRWGYKRANDETKQWLLEVPDGADPYEDQFEKKKKEKNERVAKNELQRLRNLARTQKGKVPGVGLTPTSAPSKDHVLKALAATRKSDASLGKYSAPLPKEKPNKFAGKKRKFESNFVSPDNEKSRQMGILKRMSNGEPVLDVQRAANAAIHEEEQTRSKKAKTEGGADGKRKKGGGGKAKGKGKGKGKKTFGKGKKGGKKGRRK